MVNIQPLSDAISTLEMLTKGLAPDSLRTLAAGFGLDKLSEEKALGDVLSNDLAEAAQGLFRIARGDLWKLKHADRMRLTDLAATVREVIELSSSKAQTSH